MKRILVVALLIAGCANVLPQSSVVEVPQELTFCPRGSPQPATPQPPRTTEVIADAFNKAKTAGQSTETALAECSRRLDRLNKLIDP